MTPGSAVRLTSVARHVTNCATRPRIALVRKPPCELNNFCALTTESRAMVCFGTSKMHISSQVAQAAVRSKAVVLLLFLIHCLLLLPLFVGVLCLVLVLIFSTLCPFSFAIISLGKNCFCVILLLAIYLLCNHLLCFFTCCNLVCVRTISLKLKSVQVSDKFHQGCYNFILGIPINIFTVYVENKYSLASRVKRLK